MRTSNNTASSAANDPVNQGRHRIGVDRHRNSRRRTVTAAGLSQRLCVQQRGLCGHPQQWNPGSRCRTRLFPHHQHCPTLCSNALIRRLNRRRRHDRSRRHRRHDAGAHEPVGSRSGWFVPHVVTLAQDDSHGGAAVRAHHLADEERPIRTRQHRDGTGDFMRLAESADGYRRRDGWILGFR
jgi:hypothetical protein